jgi:hypothetical protein
MSGRLRDGRFGLEIWNKGDDMIISIEISVSSISNKVLQLHLVQESVPQSKHRVAIANFCVHPIMMEKLALAGEGGGCTPTPFHPITITDSYKVAVHAPNERADHTARIPSPLPLWCSEDR